MATMRILTRTCLLLICLCISWAAGASTYETDTRSRVVADCPHGRRYGKVAVDGAGSHQLVSLGDLIDRGPDSRKVVELLMKLDAQSKQAGGAVHMVLGNHEVMVMTGDLRYVSPEEFAAFAVDETPQEREALFTEYRRFNPGGEDATVRATFDEQYPAGFVALRKAFSQDGAIGSWLVQQPFVIRVNDKVYMHGGIAGESSEESIASLNSKAQGELREFLNNMDTLREAGVMPWHVSYHDRLGFLNARAEEFVAANPKKQAAGLAALRACSTPRRPLSSVTTVPTGIAAPPCAIPTRSHSIPSDS